MDISDKKKKKKPHHFYNHTITVINRDDQKSTGQKANSWQLQWVNLAMEVNEIFYKHYFLWEYSMPVISQEGLVQSEQPILEMHATLREHAEFYSAALCAHSPAHDS